MATIDLGEARRITEEKEKQYGLPSGTLFKIGGIESSFNKGAVSPKGAQGYFQFIPETARKYGLDDPSDFVKSADAAGRYMRDNMQRYGGNIDLALADYNGGPKAVAALARGKPWAETADYLAKFHSSRAASAGGQSQELSKQFTTGSEVPLNASPSASELYRDAQQQDRKYGGVWNNVGNLPHAVGLGFQVDNSVYNFWKERGLSEVDPNFAWNDENSKQFLDGVPERHWDYMLQSKSTREATLRRSRLMDTMEKEAELGRMGMAGFGGRLVGNLVDLPTLVSFVPGMGGVGLLSKTSRLANAVRMGLVGAGTNVAFDAVTAQYRPTAVPEDLIISGLMGLGLGAAGGLSVNPKRLRLAEENGELGRFGVRESVKAQDAELREHFPNYTQDRAAFHARMKQWEGDSWKPEVDYARIDQKILERQTDEAVEPVVSRLRDEVVPEFTRTNTGKKPIKGLGDVSTKDKLVALKTSSDALIAGLAGRLESQLGDDVRIVTREGKVRSHYDPGSHEIHLAKGADDWVALHEIAHAVTANKIRYGVANPTTAHGELVAELSTVFDEVKIAAKAEAFKDHKSKYYLKNLDEFVAGIYSGKSEFIDFLARTKVADGPSFLSKAVEIVRKILGMSPGETNALTRALGITDKLIDTPLKMKQTLVMPDGSTKRKAYIMAPEGEGRFTADADTVEAANKAEIPTVFGWGLGLENRLGGGKAPAAVRELASKLFGTTVGYKDHSVVKANAWEDTAKWADSWAVEMRKGTYPAFEDWLKTSDYKWHEKGKAFDDFGTQVSNYVRGFDGDYAPQVVKAGDHMRKTLAKVVDYINNPLFDEGLKKKGLTEVEVRDIEKGTTEIVGTLEKNPNYLPRKHDINKWNDMVNSFGKDAVEGWWARAYKAGRDGVSDEAAARWSKWYVRTIEEAHANRSQDLLEDIMRGTDKDALRHSLMTNGGFDAREAQALIDDMFPTASKGAGNDAGRMSSLKHRNTIKETFVESWTRKDGSKMEVGLNDFIHANAFDVVEPYLRRTAGSVSLAKHLDIYKANHVDERIADATTNKLGTEFAAPAQLRKYREDLKFAFERIQGLPQEDFSPINKWMETWRNFNVIRLMGGAVWNQATEMAQIVGSMGWKTALAAVPELRTLKRDIATGKAPNDILDHLENTIGGVGSEYVARMDFKANDDWVRNKGDTAWNRMKDRLDTGTKKMAKGVLDYTGMTPLMIQQKRVHAVALVNHFVNVAQKGEASKLFTADRLAWMGLNDGDLKNVLGAVKKHTRESQGEFSKTFKMDFEGFAKENPQEYSKLMTAIHRESRRVVQENDLASMIPLMGSTLGKTVFQFMNFSMHGWNKSLLFAMNHRDWSTFSTVMHGSLFASVAYMARTMMSAQGMDEDKRQEFLDKRLASGQIVSNSFGRLSQASLLPVAFDTISPYPLFSGMRTTSDLSSFASNPTYQAINVFISMKKLIRNGVSDEYQTTERDIRTWGKLLPLNNVLPISTLLNALANDYPGSEEQ